MLDTQAMIDASHSGDLSPIRSIVDCKNQKLYFESHTNVPPTDLQTHAVGMLFVAIENNSDLVFGALRHLNVMHKLRPGIRFEYTAKTVESVDFGESSIAATFMDDFFMTIGSCVDSPFNGARPEALAFFDYWIRDVSVADTVLARLLTAWPWTNRNKYYFLSIIFDRHGFFEMLKRNPHLRIDVDEFMAGLSLSLQYRNLISPGQTLAITLTRQQVPQIFTAISAILREDSFRMTNCFNHWMRCISNGHVVFDLLELNSDRLLDDSKFAYLLENSMQRLILFRSCFKASFAQSPNCPKVDAFIMDNEQVWNVPANKVALLDFIITKTMSHPDDLETNLPVLERALKSNMQDLSPSLRNDVLKMLPNLMYLMAPIVKANTHTPRIREFFRFLRHDIFESGVRLIHEYPPLIYALRVYEIVVKTLYGSRSDRLIKRFNPDVNERLQRLLDEELVWPLFTGQSYQTLCALLQSEFNDVREIACELLIRFFPQNDMLEQCRSAINHFDDFQCGYAHYMARVAIHFDQQDEADFYKSLHAFLQTNLDDYADPLRRIRSGGGHLFGALNCINEFYIRHNFKYRNETRGPAGFELSAHQIAGDLRLATDVVGLVLAFFRYGSEGGDSEATGSPSFEKMDESLTQLVERSEWLEDGRLEESAKERLREQNKKWLLMSLWSSMKAACDLATSIGIYLLDHTPDDRSIEQCYQLSVRVLLQCRHKGAIEAAGLSLGRLVAAITQRSPITSPLYGHLLDSLSTMFGIVSRTDTTRRGAGFSIMVLHLVKSDRNKDKPILNHVMKKLLAQGTEMQANPNTNSHRDNMLASVLHFMCVLVKDGELRLALTEYMGEIFEITVATIDSREWVVRNASLQLFGALVPKLVGQSQFFINDLAWEPVHLLYTDIRLKMHALHSKIIHLLRKTQNPSPTILLVTILQLLSRTETVDIQVPTEAEFRAHFFRLLAHTNMKVRELAAQCMARFHQFYEIPDFVEQIVPLMCSAAVDANLRHGILCTVEQMLSKYESDSRRMPFADGWVNVQRNLQTVFHTHWNEKSWRRQEAGRYYLSVQLYRVLRAIGLEDSDDLMREYVFDESKDELCIKDSEHLGFSAWNNLIMCTRLVRPEKILDNCPVMELRRRADES